MNHPDEARSLTGIGQGVVDHLLRELRKKCAREGIPMPDQGSFLRASSLSRAGLNVTVKFSFTCEETSTSEEGYCCYEETDTRRRRGGRRRETRCSSTKSSRTLASRRSSSSSRTNTRVPSTPRRRFRRATRRSRSLRRGTRGGWDWKRKRKGETETERLHPDEGDRRLRDLVGHVQERFVR